jgi:hypothetical protein
MNKTKFNRGLISFRLVGLFLLQIVPAFAWGNEGHVYVKRVAAQKIPVSMPLFLRRTVTEITYILARNRIAGAVLSSWSGLPLYFLRNRALERYSGAGSARALSSKVESTKISNRSELVQCPDVNPLVTSTAINSFSWSMG